jgi:hypothetical protein
MVARTTPSSSLCQYPQFGCVFPRASAPPSLFLAATHCIDGSVGGEEGNGGRRQAQRRRPTPTDPLRSFLGYGGGGAVSIPGFQPGRRAAATTKLPYTTLYSLLASLLSCTATKVLFAGIPKYSARLRHHDRERPPSTTPMNLAIYLPLPATAPLVSHRPLPSLPLTHKPQPSEVDNHRLKPHADVRLPILHLPFYRILHVTPTYLTC